MDLMSFHSDYWRSPQLSEIFSYILIIGAVLLAALVLFGCASEPVFLPPDGGPASAPFGQSLSCAKNPEDMFCV